MKFYSTINIAKTDNIYYLSFFIILFFFHSKNKLLKNIWRKEKEKIKMDETPKLKQFYASGMTLINGSWKSCGWTIEAHSFSEAAQIAENDKTFRIHTLSDNVIY